jgi:type II secretory pathway pseudopilin PulG
VRTTPARPAPEAGFALIEILVSALIVVIVGGAVLTLLQTTARSAGDQRRHATAFSLAQEDQSRLRTSRLATLNNLQQTREVKVDGTTYTVESTGVFVNSGSGTASCTEGYESADYAKIGSTVTWPGIGSRKPVRLESIVAPSSGSLDPSHGSLTISATNAAGVPLSGVSISGTGPGTFSGSTDESGCASFTDLPEGNYTMTTSANGLVDENGDAVGNRLVGVIASGNQTVVMRFDSPGTAIVDFKYRDDSSGELKAAPVDSMFLYHPELSGSGVVKGDPGGSKETPRSASLFPFTTPYTVYAGSCTSNNPNPDEEEGAPGEAAMAGVTVPSGEIGEAEVQVPALYATVKYGSSLVENAEVVITDDECKEGSQYVERDYVSNNEGRQSEGGGTDATEPALPWGRYNVCAAAYVSSRYRRQYVNNVNVKSLTSGTYVTVDLGGSGANSSSWYQYTC